MTFFTYCYWHCKTNHDQPDDIVNFYKQNMKSINQTDMLAVFELCCTHDYIKIAKWLFSQINITNAEYNRLFIHSCNKGCTQIITWLYSLRNTKVQYHTRKQVRPYTLIICNENFDQVFRHYCINGRLKLAQLFFDIGAYSLEDLHSDNDCAFRHSCSNGHLEVAQWLHSLDNTTNIHACDEYAFRRSCSGGHLEVAQWLYSLDNTTDIHACDKYALRQSCEKGHTEIAQWLLAVECSSPIIITVYCPLPLKVITTATRFLLTEYCKKNDLENAKKLYNVWKCTIMPDTTQYFHMKIAIMSVFTELCQRGCCLEFVEWIYSLNMLTIGYIRATLKMCCQHENPNFAICNRLYELDTARDEDFFEHINSTFITCCIHNRKVTAMWLYNKGQVNITTHDDYAFRQCCDNGYISLAIWLANINENYQIIYSIETSKIEYKIRNIGWFYSLKSCLFIF